MGAILKRELNSYFNSAIAYIFLSVCCICSGYFFYGGPLRAATSDMSSMFNALFMVILILIPVLTMKLLSEEKKQKTDQGLLTAPISLWSIVLGKYFAALTLYTMGISIIFVYALILSYFGAVLWTSVLANFLALFLLGAAFIAVGLFVSSLTENQMSSAVASFLALMLLYMIDSLAALFQSETIKDIFVSLSFYTRYMEFTMGMFNLSSVIFYISAAFLFNFFSVRVLEKRRWS